jgi:hypothetical protein
MSTPVPRTLADQFRNWPDERLGALLDARPDLSTPAPTDSAQLAARAAVRVSVVRALDLLDRLHLDVLLAVVQTGPTDATDLTTVVRSAPAAIAAALSRLDALALVWGPPDAVRAVSMVAEVIGLPGGPAPDAVPGLLARLDDRARTILDHLDESDAVGTVAELRIPVRFEQATTPTEQLLALGLLVPRDERQVAVPWTVRLALRGGRSTSDPVDEVPAFSDANRDTALVDRTAGGAAFEFLRRTEMLLESWATQPPAGLRSGGLAVRDLRAAATLLHCEPAHAALIIETAAAAHLLAQGMNDELDAAWLPTDAYDAWTTRTGGERWAALASAWLDNPRLASAIGGRDGDRPMNALASGLERSWLVEERRAVLAELLHLDPGTGLAAGTGVASLVTRLRWRYPRRPAGRLDLVPTLLDEAAHLGLLGLEAASTFGRQLLVGADPATTLDRLLPEPIDHVLIQADLTAIAPGPLHQDFARRLGLVADIESRGGATVYRFSGDSVRRAFDAGWSSLEVKDFLHDSSRTPVPQALDFLVDDVSRRFGTLRVGVAESFLRSDDETALTELLHHPAAGALRLRRIAPTVVVSDVPLQVLLPKLRELGAAPVVEAADGTVRIARRDEFRARTPRPAPGQDRALARRAARTSAVVAAVRAGDRAAAARPARGPATTPGDVLALLRTATGGDDRVRIGYLDNHGTNSERTVRPLTVGGGELTAYDERHDEVRRFAIHRITRAHLEERKDPGHG